MLAPRLVERAEDLVQHQERQGLARPLRDHLGDREPQHEVGEVLLSARNDRLGDAALEDGHRVVLGELELVVAAVREVRQEARGELRDLGAHARVQLTPQVGEGPVELVVQPLARLARGDLARTSSSARVRSPRASTTASSASRSAPTVRS